MSTGNAADDVSNIGSFHETGAAGVAERASPTIAAGAVLMPFAYLIAFLPLAL